MSIVNELAQRHCCLFGDADAYCGASASVHILQLGDYPTMSCAEHMSWWEENPYQDKHPLMPTCGMPGTTWMYAAISESGYDPGFCVVEELGDHVLIEHAHATS